VEKAITANYSSLVDLPQPAVQMSFEEAAPVEVVLEIDDAPIVDDVEPEVVVDEPVVENTNPAAVSVFNFENHNVRTVVDDNGGSLVCGERCC
jgi:hypothetical protein